MKSVKTDIYPLRPPREVDLPFAESIGYQTRMTHRTLQRLLQLRIEPHGITLGMWYFLRALWAEDGLTQRELSRRVGTTEPTVLIAIQSMEKRGLVKRTQHKTDRRKWQIHLTAKGRKLKEAVIPLARDVVDVARQGLSAADVNELMRLLSAVQKNLRTKIEEIESAELLQAELPPKKLRRARRA